MEVQLSNWNYDVPVEEVERCICAQAAPGCSIATASVARETSFSVGRFDGPNSPEVTPQTVYDVASISKLFTAALILRLQESGSISIDDRCGDYLDNFAQSEIRLADLLTHRVDFNIFLSNYRDKHPDAAGLHAALMQIKPPARPSKCIHYGNLEFVYLGEIVERVTKRDLKSNMDTLFKDLGLQETYTGPDITRLGISTPATETVNGKIIQGETHDETARTLGGIAGNAGIFSTAEDLIKFGKAWLEGKILSQANFDRLVLKDYDQSGAQPQTLGWWMRFSTANSVRNTPGVLSHTGYTGSMLILNPQNNKVAALTCNRTYYGRNNVKQRQIWELLADWAQE